MFTSFGSKFGITYIHTSDAEDEESHNYFHLLLICNLVYSREISIKMMANKQLRKTIFCLAMPSAARLLLYSYVQRNVNVQDNTTQYLERVWFDYCSVHVSTMTASI
ncbi:hypothetical protein T06_16841 [Trichinella sp. T6]|nr:hypothetical protein T06_16841 [Trichinella sp. T6]